MKKILFLFALSSLLTNTGPAETSAFTSNWSKQPDGYWPGPEYWPNRIQDWQIRNGRLECLEGTRANRTVHLLTRFLSGRRGTLRMRAELGAAHPGAGDDDEAFAGFLVGAGDLNLDYRARAQIHNSYGNNAGLAAAVTRKGKLIFRDNEEPDRKVPIETLMPGSLTLREKEPVRIVLEMEPAAKGYDLVLSGYAGKKLAARIKTAGYPAAKLTGNVALISHKGGGAFWFSKWEMSGNKLEAAAERAYGPVWGVLYTVSRGVLKLTAQLPPLSKEDKPYAVMEIRPAGEEKWLPKTKAEMVFPGWTAHFRAADWDMSRDCEYRVGVRLKTHPEAFKDRWYKGAIPKEPLKDEIVIAAFTGNYNGPGFRDWRPEPHFYDFSRNRMWFPHDEIDENVKKFRPDLLVYTGDQIYEGSFVRPDKSGEFSSCLDYLNKWILFHWAHGDLTRNIPTVCITDDHDVYQINLWGAGGKKAREMPEAESWEEMIRKLPERYRKAHQHWRHDGGGYEMPPDWVNMVQRTQCGHLPDPYDPAPVKQDIEVYYTDMLYGGISFAIIEDRKFKSAPGPLLPEALVRNGHPTAPGYDVHESDHPDAVLLGERQLKFLNEWAADWKGADAKVVLSATVFACANSTRTKERDDQHNEHGIPLPGIEPDNYKPSEDMDTNGWPQTGRNKALAAIRKGFGFMIAGDQHLGTIIHHGIEEWADAGFSFCVPANANIAPRRWFTPAPGLHRRPGMPRYCGNHFDAFGNRIHVWAASNPSVTGKKPAELYDRATGCGIIRINKKTQKITMECWPRHANPEDPDAEQYPGWPKTIQFADNDGRKAKAWLPTLKTKGLGKPPVFQVVDEADGEIVYTFRAKQSSFTPKVFHSGVYTVRCGEPGTTQWKTLKGIKSVDEPGAKEIAVQF